MILAIYLAVTTLLVTFMTVSVPRDVFLTRLRLMGPSDGFPTRTLSSPVRSVIDTIPGLLGDHARRVANLKEAPYQYGVVSLNHIRGFAPSASITSDASETVKLVEPNFEPCLALSPSALICILFITVAFTVCARFVSLSTRPPEYDSDAEIYMSSPASVDESGHPSKGEHVPIEFEHLIDEISDPNVINMSSWKVCGGHLTVFYMPDAPSADEEIGFQVDVGGAYKFLVIPVLAGESVVESMVSPVCGCDNITQIVSTPADVTSSPSANTDTVALPPAITSPDIPAVLVSADSPLLLPLLGSTSSEHELRNLLSTIPISVSDEFILDPRDWNIPSMTNDMPEHQDISVVQPSTSPPLIMLTSISDIDDEMTRFESLFMPAEVDASTDVSAL